MHSALWNEEDSTAGSVGRVELAGDGRRQTSR